MALPHCRGARKVSKKIPLTQGQFAIVDDEDFDKFSVFEWHAFWNKHTNSFYAQRNIPKNGRQTSSYLHREIMGNPPGKMVDHKNNNTLDCQRSNLRSCTKSQNQMNRKGPQRNSSSLVRGVFFNKHSGKWVVRIGKDGKKSYFGSFSSITKATETSECARKQLFGEFA